MRHVDRLQNTKSSQQGTNYPINAKCHKNYYSFAKIIPYVSLCFVLRYVTCILISYASKLSFTWQTFLISQQTLLKVHFGAHTVLPFNVNITENFSKYIFWIVCPGEGKP